MIKTHLWKNSIAMPIDSYRFQNNNEKKRFQIEKIQDYSKIQQKRENFDFRRFVSGLIFQQFLMYK